MTNDTDYVIDRVPHSKILQVPRALDYENIAEVNLILNVNVFSVHSNIKDRAHGRLVLTMFLTQYTTISIT